MAPCRCCTGACGAKLGAARVAPVTWASPEPAAPTAGDTIVDCDPVEKLPRSSEVRDDAVDDCRESKHDVAQTMPRRRADDFFTLRQRHLNAVLRKIRPDLKDQIDEIIGLDGKFLRNRDGDDVLWVYVTTRDSVADTGLPHRTYLRAERTIADAIEDAGIPEFVICRWELESEREQRRASRRR